MFRIGSAIDGAHPIAKILFGRALLIAPPNQKHCVTVPSSSTIHGSPRRTPLQCGYYKYILYYVVSVVRRTQRDIYLRSMLH